MEQFNILTQAQLPSAEFDTIGGFVLHLFGNLPSIGDEYTYQGFIFRIENVGRSRILKIRVELEKDQIKDIWVSI